MTYQPIYDEATNKVIRKTNDYNKFNFLVYNRPIKKKHVEKLMMEIEKKDHESIIIVDKYYNIIDGQHRFCAYKALGLPFHYVQLELFELAETADYFVAINNNSKRLDTVDYVKCLDNAYRLANDKDSLPWQYAKCHKFVEYYDRVVSNFEVDITFANYVKMMDRVVYLTNMKIEKKSTPEKVDERFNEFKKMLPMCIPVYAALKSHKQLTTASLAAVMEFCKKKAVMDADIMHNLAIAYNKYGAFDEFFRRMPVGIPRIYDRFIDLYNFRKREANRLEN